MTDTAKWYSKVWVLFTIALVILKIVKVITVKWGIVLLAWLIPTLCLVLIVKAIKEK